MGRTLKGFGRSDTLHDVLTIGVPVLVILAGILLNRQDTNVLRSELHSEVSGLRGEVHSEISSLRAEMNQRFDSIQRDMREFYAEQARHDIRLGKLERASN